MSVNYWLLKSEPTEFSIHDFKRHPCQTAAWDGIRNYQARNYLRDSMQIGDLALFYHSSCPDPSIVGLVRIVSEAQGDPAALNPKSPYYDPRSTPENPRWFIRYLHWIETFKLPLTLAEIKQDPILSTMVVAHIGRTRLSISPVTSIQYERVRQFVL